MSKLDFLQALASFLGVISFGFGLGIWFANRRKFNEHYERTLAKVRKGLLSISLQDFSVSPLMLERGEKLELCYHIGNKLESEIELWLGADIWNADNGIFFDVGQDKNITLTPNAVQKHTRYLTIGMGVQPGNYRLHAAVWLGKISAPDQSVILKRWDKEIIIRVK